MKVIEALLTRVEELEARVAALVERVCLLEGVPYVEPAKDLLGLPAVVDPTDLARQAIVLWNLMAERCREQNEKDGLSQASTTKIKNPRAAAIRRCIKQVGGLEGWKGALEHVVASNFLRGRNDRGWKADIDFIIRDEKFTKLIGGGYDHDYGKLPNGSNSLGPNGRGPSRDDIRRGALAGLEASGRLETEGRSES